MRVIAGSARSLHLKTPRGFDTRPTTDRIKETLFNIIAANIPDSRVLDLFAGSGALGIEALSRGAGYVYFIENNSEACKCINENLNFTKFTEKGRVIKGDVFKGLVQIKEPVIDMIFIDPPYRSDYEKKLFDLLAQQTYINENTLIILEAGADMLADDFLNKAFLAEREKVYKTNKHIFIRKSGK